MSSPQNPITLVVFLNSHPIQYFAPLYQYLQQQPELDCTALYCSTHGLQGERDEQFGVAVQWDVPILEGYPSVFLQNYSFRPSINRFWGLLNLGVIPYLYRQPRSVVIVHGWNYATHCLTLVAARLLGHVVCLRAETPANQELLRSARVRYLRKLFFKLFLNPLVDFFLPIGQQNRQFYQLYGVSERKLLPLPYTVDNKRFQQEAQQCRGLRASLCAEWGLDPQRRIFLLVGKYISKKRPLDLLLAYARMAKRQQAALILVGEGELRSDLEALIAREKLEQVLLTGFVNQGQISRYYAVADVLVMCSESGETWGLAVNEAMNFGLPIILSDMVGCSDDLVVPGLNGWVYKCGDIIGLTKCMEEFLSLKKETQIEMGEASKAIINNYSFEVIKQQLNKIEITTLSK